MWPKIIFQIKNFSERPLSPNHYTRSFSHCGVMKTLDAAAGHDRNFTRALLLLSDIKTTLKFYLLTNLRLYPSLTTVCKSRFAAAFKNLLCILQILLSIFLRLLNCRKGFVEDGDEAFLFGEGWERNDNFLIFLHLQISYSS